MPEKFNPTDPQFEHVTDLPIEEQSNFADYENGFVRKEAMQVLKDAEIKGKVGVMEKIFGEKRKSISAVDVLSNKAHENRIVWERIENCKSIEDIYDIYKNLIYYGYKGSSVVPAETFVASDKYYEEFRKKWVEFLSTPAEFKYYFNGFSSGYIGEPNPHYNRLDLDVLEKWTSACKDKHDVKEMMNFFLVSIYHGKSYIKFNEGDERGKYEVCLRRDMWGEEKEIFMNFLSGSLLESKKEQTQ